MKKKDLFSLLQGLRNVGYHSGVRFAIAVDKNIRKISLECQSIEKGIEYTSEYSEYHQKRIEIAKPFADPESNGLITVPLNKLDAFKAALQPLNEEYKDALEAREKQEKEYAEVLEEEIEIELTLIPDSDLPEKITADELSSIYLARVK